VLVGVLTGVGICWGLRHAGRPQAALRTAWPAPRRCSLCNVGQLKLFLEACGTRMIRVRMTGNRIRIGCRGRAQSCIQGPVRLQARVRVGYITYACEQAPATAR